MKQLTRLYRIENLWGNGLYQSNPNLGERVSFTEITMSEKYYFGQKKIVDFTDRAGAKRTYNHIREINHFMENGDGSIPFNWNTRSKPVQLGLAFADDVDITKYRAQFTLDDLNGRMKHQPILLTNQITEQLLIECTVPDKVVDHVMERLGSLTLMEVILTHLTGKHNNRYADACSARPMPNDDGISKVGGHDHFAFDSLEKMSSWFDGASPESLLACGAAIRVMDVRKVQRGGQQVTYKKRDVMKEFVILSQHTNRG